MNFCYKRMNSFLVNKGSSGVNYSKHTDGNLGKAKVVQQKHCLVILLIYSQMKRRALVFERSHQFPKFVNAIPGVVTGMSNMKRFCCNLLTC